MNEKSIIKLPFYYSIGIIVLGYLLGIVPGILLTIGRSNYKKGKNMVVYPIIALGFAIVVLGGGLINQPASSTKDPINTASASEEKPKEEEKKAPEPEKKAEAPVKETIPTEYKSALKKGESYSKTMYMSKQGVYNQLTSEYGEKFSAEAAQYAVDNMTADWNYNALQKAKSYQKTMSMSPEKIREQLVSEYGEKFTQEEADYAIANLE